MKETLRSIMPVAMYRGLKILRDRRKLARLERRGCETAPLRRRSEIDLQRIFALSEWRPKWDDQLRRIGALGVSQTAGGVNPGDRRAISYLIGALRPRSVLEVGTHIGASTVHLAAAMADSSPGEDAASRRLVTVDIADVNDPIGKPWLKFGSSRSPRELAATLGLDEMVEFVARPSVQYLADCRTQFDLIFLDGSHAAEMVYQEVPLALRALNDNGIILLHDYFPHLKPLWPNGSVIAGPYLATERLKREGADITVLPLGELPWSTKFGTNRTSLALLLRDG